MEKYVIDFSQASNAIHLNKALNIFICGVVFIAGVSASLSPSTLIVNEGNNYTVTISLDKPPGTRIGLVIQTNPLSATGTYVVM